MKLKVGNTSDVLEVCSRSVSAIVVVTHAGPRRLGGGGGGGSLSKNTRE